MLFAFVLEFFFFNDTATTEIYTLSLHDALPISSRATPAVSKRRWRSSTRRGRSAATACGDESSHCSRADRKSTRLNSSHSQISYAVFCLKKKKRFREISFVTALVVLHLLCFYVR